jgi:methionyl-tRNA formyltransferase
VRVFFAGNNRLGLNILKWLVDNGTTIVGLGIHPEDRWSYGEEILSAAALNDDAIIQGSQIRSNESADRIKALQPDIIVSVLFGYILPDTILGTPPCGCINLHPAYLPFNRGVYPNVWSIVEGTPAGVTLHYMDAQVDTGDIIARQRVDVTPTDTGQSLYRKLEDAAESLFVETWPSLVRGDLSVSKQKAEEGTFHRFRDVVNIDRIDLDSNYRAGDLINIIRARTFPPYDGAYFIHEGQRVFLRIEFIEDSETES